MEKIRQGDVLRVSGVKDPILVVSNDSFNQMREILACPILRDIEQNAIHPQVQIHINQQEISALVACEDPRHLDLKSRRYTRMGSIDYFQMMDIADILIGMIEYI